MDRRLPENEGSQPGILAGNHLAEDVLELYSLGKLSSVEDETAVEDHIFECAHCHARFDRIDAFVNATRSAAKAIPSDFKRSNPKLMLSLAIAATIASVLFIPRITERDTGAVDLNLTSVRSEAPAEAPASRALGLNLDITGLDPEQHFFEVASVDGKIVVSGQLNPNESKLKLDPLAQGQYWVRLKSAKTGQILREFSLLAR
jgi:hypothetical protein